MLIINADDFGRSRLATDRTIDCHVRGTVSSASAMVFMDDSQRASELALEYGVETGLHLNFTSGFTQRKEHASLHDYQERIVGYLTRNNYNFLIYNPALRRHFHYVFQCQVEEFERLFGRAPSHINGHHHMHLCANMLFGSPLPAGCAVRKNFSFAPGEKSFLNRTYRSLVDTWLARRYRLTDYFFSLSDCLKTGKLAALLELAKSAAVELESHPEVEEEFTWLTGTASVLALSGIGKGSYGQLDTSLYTGVDP